MQLYVASGRVRTFTLSVLGFFLPLFASAVGAAPSSTPPPWVSSISPGTWSAISQNTMADVDPERDPALNPNFPGNAPWHGNSGQKGVLTTWNGGALATGYGTHGALLTYGGGHAGYYGSEVYAFDLGTRMWKRASNPYTGSISWPYASTAYPDGSPVPSHTYDYVDYHPTTNSFVLMRGLKDGYASTNDTGTAIVHMLDLDTGQWRRSRQNGSLRMHSGGISCYDRTRDSFWVLGAASTTNQFTRFDPNTTNSDGTVGSFTNFAPPKLDIDGGADCDPVNDIFVYTQFRYTDQIYAVDLKNPTAARVALKQTGDIPPIASAGGWAWSDKRQAFLFWRRGAGVYEFKLVEGGWATGTWRWTNLTASANSIAPQDMLGDNGVYSRFRVMTWGNEEVAVVVNRNDGPVYAFRVPSGAQSSMPVSVVLSASPRNIQAGGQSTLSWSASNASSCTASGAWSGTQPVSGSTTVGPLSLSALYQLDCRSSTGSLGRASIEVTVGSATQPSSNAAPDISGSPPTTLVAGSTYSFLPSAADAEGDPLTFSVQNLPSWATFNAATGEVVGVPTMADVGTYSGIVVSVSDGGQTVSMPSFGITVVAQGTYGGTLAWQPPTVDGDGDPLNDLAGYKVYIGNQSRNYTQSFRIANPGVTSYNVTGLVAGTYYLAVTSYDASDNESPASNEIKAILGVTSGGTAGSGTGGSTGGGTTGGSAGGETGGGTTGGTPTDGSAGGSSGGISAMSWLDLALMLILISYVGFIKRNSGVKAMHFKSIGGATSRVATVFAAALSVGLALTGVVKADDADFQQRCSAPGVVKCVGFDGAADFQEVFPAGDGVIRGKFDSSQKASGAGSLRFEVPPYSGANSSGFWMSDLGAHFGAGDKMYWQFRFRMTPERLNAATSSWKQFIIHSSGNSCAATQLVLGRYYNTDYMTYVTQCGSRRVGPDDPDRGGDERLINSGDYYCQYGKLNPTSCATWATNQWMTFYFEVEIGTLSVENSTLRAYVAKDGEPLRKFIDVSNFRIEASTGPDSTFDKMQLTPYQTGKDPTVNHPTGYVWYDELIVSTKPIAPPAGGGVITPPVGADSTAPSAPTVLGFQAN